jgi:hypothetical protein
MTKVTAKQKQVVFDADEASVACEELERCREVLLIGLASYGELGRLSEVQNMYASELNAPDEDGVTQPINQELQVRYEDRGLGTVSNFAQALKYLDILMRKMLEAGERPDPDYATRKSC